MDTKTVAEDFSYYERTVKKSYHDYYKKWLIVSGVLLVIQIATLFYSGQTSWFDYLIILILTGILGFGFKQYQDFPDFFTQAQAVEQKSLVSEDGKYYYIQAENLKFRKKGSRNLPSKEKGLTFFIGIRPWNFTQPVAIRYYDMLEITYTDKFKQNNHQVSFAKNRWKYRLRSWFSRLPLLLVLFYIFFFRLSFIWSGLWRLLSSLF